MWRWKRPELSEHTAPNTLPDAFAACKGESLAQRSLVPCGILCSCHRGQARNVTRKHRSKHRHGKSGSGKSDHGGDGSSRGMRRSRSRRGMRRSRSKRRTNQADAALQGELDSLLNEFGSPAVAAPPADAPAVGGKAISGDGPSSSATAHATTQQDILIEEELARSDASATVAGLPDENLPYRYHLVFSFFCLYD